METAFELDKDSAKTSFTGWSHGDCFCFKATKNDNLDIIVAAILSNHFSMETSFELDKDSAKTSFPGWPYGDCQRVG